MSRDGSHDDQGGLPASSSPPATQPAARAAVATQQQPKGKMHSLLDSENTQLLLDNTATPFDTETDEQRRAFVHGLLGCVRANPALLACEPIAIRNILMTCARGRILPDGNNAAIVLFKGVPQLQIMTRGMEMVARRAGLNIVSSVVTKQDDFDYNPSPPSVRHRPDIAASKKLDNLIGCYAYYEVSGRILQIVWCNMEDQKNFADASHNNPAWKGDFAHEMFRTKTIKRLLKTAISTSFAMGVEKHGEATAAAEVSKADHATG